MRADAYLAAVRALPIGGLDDLASAGPLLVLAPHPDDESLGCGGVIAEAVHRGRAVHVLFVTDGSASHPGSRSYPPPRLAALRAEEARSALALLGVAQRDIGFLGLADSQASVDGPAFESAVARVSALASRIDPAALFATWEHEPHCDHQAGWTLARRVAARLSCPLYAFLVWGWQLASETELPAAAPTGWRLDVAAHQSAKRAAIARHRSQTTGLIDDADGFRLTPEMIAGLTGAHEHFIRASP